MPQRHVADGRRASLRLADVSGRVLVHGLDTREVPRLVGGEGHRKVVALLQPGQAAEIGQALAFLFGHVVAVGQVRPGDSLVPGVAANRVPRDLRDRVPDVVVITDGVQGLVLHARRPLRGDAHAQQRGIEELLLRRRVQLEEDRQPSPDGGQRSDVRPVDLLDDREQPALLMMIVKDQLGDVHARTPHCTQSDDALATGWHSCYARGASRSQANDLLVRRTARAAAEARPASGSTW